MEKSGEDGTDKAQEKEEAIGGVGIEGEQVGEVTQEELWRTPTFKN